MIKHVVLLNWKEGVSQQQIDRVGQELGRLKDEIEEIRAYEFGPDAAIFRGNASYALVAEFETEDAFKRYVTHEKHQAFLSDVAGPILESFQSTQFVVGA
jgi:hypothetical protein